MRFKFGHPEKIKFIIFVVSLVLLWYLGRYIPVDGSAIQEALRKFSLFYAGIIFVALYVVVTFFVWFSKDVFKVLSAVLFGAYVSTLFIWIAEIINAFILFYLARILGRDFAARHIKGKYKNLDDRLYKANFFWLFTFRFVPLIPFRFLDLASGMTGVPFRRYLLAVILASPLRIFWVQYVIVGVGESIFKKPQLMLEYLAVNKTVYIFSLIYLVLVILLIFKLKKG